MTDYYDEYIGDDYEEDYYEGYEYQGDGIEACETDDGVCEEDADDGIPVNHALIIWLIAAVMGLFVTIKPVEDMKVYFSALAAPYAAMLPLAQDSIPQLPVMQLKGNMVFGKENVVNAKISWYWPDLGGTNCARFVNGHCVSKTASGDPWQWWVDKGCACPKQFPFGTQFLIDGRIWTCVDRGGKIAFLPDGTFWIDLLTNSPLYPYGKIVPVTILYP